MADYSNFIEKLEASHDFPTDYTFKFIVPTSSLAELEKAIGSNGLERKPSRNGNYISVTLKMVCQDAQEVVAYYERASRVNGLISL